MISGIACIALSLFLGYQGLAYQGAFDSYWLTFNNSNIVISMLACGVLKWALIFSVVGLACGIFFIYESRHSSKIPPSFAMFVVIFWSILSFVSVL